MPYLLEIKFYFFFWSSKFSDINYKVLVGFIYRNTNSCEFCGVCLDCNRIVMNFWCQKFFLVVSSNSNVVNCIYFNPSYIWIGNLKIKDEKSPSLNRFCKFSLINKCVLKTCALNFILNICYNIAFIVSYWKFKYCV